MEAAAPMPCKQRAPTNRPLLRASTEQKVCAAAAPARAPPSESIVAMCSPSAAAASEYAPPSTGAVASTSQWPGTSSSSSPPPGCAPAGSRSTRHTSTCGGTSACACGSPCSKLAWRGREPPFQRSWRRSLAPVPSSSAQAQRGGRVSSTIGCPAEERASLCMPTDLYRVPADLHFIPRPPLQQLVLQAEPQRAPEAGHVGAAAGAARHAAHGGRQLRRGAPLQRQPVLRGGPTAGPGAGQFSRGLVAWRRYADPCSRA